MTKRAACATVDLTATEGMASKYACHAVPSGATAMYGKPFSSPVLTDADNDREAKPLAHSKKDPPVVDFINDNEDRPKKKRKISHYSSDSGFGSVDYSFGPPVQDPFEGMEAKKRDAILAKHLRQEEGHLSFSFQAVTSTDSSHSVARMPAMESTGAASWDEAMARRLQEEFDEQAAARKALEEQQMKESVTGKALELVKGVLQIQEELAQTFPDVAGHINCVARDDMVYMAETTLKERQSMEAQGIPVGMDIGYHFTRPQNMVHIRTGGLLTRQDRDARGIATNFNGAAMGDGIYTANDTSYAGGGRYGNTGLLVARLKGVESSEAGARRASGANSVQHDTYVQGNIVVLRRSSQCLALLEFDRSLLQDSAKAQVIWAAHVKLQQLLDQCLNGGVQSTVWISHRAQMLFDKDAKSGTGVISRVQRRQRVFCQRRSGRASRHQQPVQHSVPQPVQQPVQQPNIPVIMQSMQLQLLARSLQQSQQLQQCHLTQLSHLKLQIQQLDPQEQQQLNPQIQQIQQQMDQKLQQQHQTVPATTAGPLLLSQQSPFKASQKQQATSTATIGPISTPVTPQQSSSHANQQSQQQQSASNATVWPVSSPGAQQQSSSPRQIQKQQQTVSRTTIWPISTQAAQQLSTYHPSQLTQQFQQQQQTASTATIWPISTQAGPQSLSLSAPSVNVGVLQPPSASGASSNGPNIQFHPSNTSPSGFQNGVGSSQVSQSHADQKPPHVVNYTAPDSLKIVPSDDMFTASVPTPSSGSDCSICLCEMKSNGQQEVKCLAKCGHTFHFACISRALEKHRQCPNCRTFLGTPRGKMPSGSMSVTFDSRMTCGGHLPGTICIHYSIQGGIQKEYHDNPGVRFGSTTRRAYLPDCLEGRDLLKRLRYAFAHGLSFTVGTSLTTRQPNTVTWSSVHHKTTPRGGAHGFPDPNYFTNCNSELDHLGVPAAKDL